MESARTDTPALREARLIAVSERLAGSGGHAPHPVYLARVESGNGETAVVLKLTGRRKVVTEAAALIVAQALSLPTLEGFLVSNIENFRERFEETPTESPFLFATTKENLVSLHDKGISWDADFWDEAVTSGWFRVLYVFDVLLGNYDRVQRNIQFRGEVGDAALVVCDHDKSFLTERWHPLALPELKERAGHSSLARFNQKLSKGIRSEIVRLAGAWSQQLAGTGFPDFSLLGKGGLSSSLERKNIRRFIEYRAAHLPELVERVLERP